MLLLSCVPVDVSHDKNSTEQASQMFYIMQPFQTLKKKKKLAACYLNTPLV